MSDKRLIKSVARLRKALEKELSELDVLIDDQIRGSAVWVEKEDLLASVTHPGRPGSHSLPDANDRRLALRGKRLGHRLSVASIAISR